VNFSSFFADRVISERKRLGLSQDEAGRACGVSREMWGKYERGKAVMGTNILAQFVAIGADALYVLTGQRAELRPEEFALLDNYRHSPPDEQRLLRETSASFAQHAPQYEQNKRYA